MWDNISSHKHVIGIPEGTSNSEKNKEDDGQTFSKFGDKHQPKKNLRSSVKLKQGCKRRKDILGTS